MEFPRTVLLVTFNVVEDKIDFGLEGTMVFPVEAFDTEAIASSTFETAIICWSSLFGIPERSADLADIELRKRLIDWVNLEVSPRLRASRRPVWL